MFLYEYGGLRMDFEGSIGLANRCRKYAARLAEAELILPLIASFIAFRYF